MFFHCKIMVVREDGIYFSGIHYLATSPEDAKIFYDLDEVLDTVRSLITLATSPVTQIRIIGAEGKE